MHPDFDQQVERFHSLYSALKSDVDHYWPIVGQDHSDDRARVRRSAVRATFAFVEGVVYGLKQLCFLQSESAGLTRSEIALLLEESYELDDKGRPQTRVAKLRTKDNVRFAVASFAKVIGKADPINGDSADWRNLVTAMKVRDRLVHPKSASDLIVSPEECSQVFRAYTWFHAVLGVFFGPRDDKRDCRARTEGNGSSSGPEDTA